MSRAPECAVNDFSKSASDSPGVSRAKRKAGAPVNRRRAKTGDRRCTIGSSLFHIWRGTRRWAYGSVAASPNSFSTLPRHCQEAVANASAQCQRIVVDAINVKAGVGVHFLHLVFMALDKRPEQLAAFLKSGRGFR